MLSRLLLVALAAATAAAAAETGTAAGAETATGATTDEKGSNRESKLHFPLFQIVSFENNACEAQSGEYGTCYSQKECDSLGGSGSGTCANGFGVCCVLLATCGEVISVNNTYFVNKDNPSPSVVGYRDPPPGYKPSPTNTDNAAPGYGYGYGYGYGQPSGGVAYAPAPAMGHGGIIMMPTSCMLSIEPPAGTCQILLTFDEFDLAGPTEGDCTNDTFVVHGANPGTDIPTLCGNNAGQHMYIDVDNSQGPFKLAVMMSNAPVLRRWKIKVTFIEAHNPCKPPARCLQYYKETSGAFSSFNYHGNPPMMLNNQNYAICFAYVPGFCDVGLHFNRFDLGNTHGDCGMSDYVGVRNDKICGDFQQLAVNANATGPINLQVLSDDMNEREEEGFFATYMMMACH